MVRSGGNRLRRLICGASMVVLSLGLAGPAMAQANENEVEEVVIPGFRGSLASAIEAKADRERLDGQTAQVAELLARLISGGASKDNAAAIITALLNQQTAMAVGSNSKAQVILTPTGLTIPDNISALTARPAPANTPAASVE